MGFSPRGQRRGLKASWVDSGRGPEGSLFHGGAEVCGVRNGLVASWNRVVSKSAKRMAWLVTIRLVGFVHGVHERLLKRLGWKSRPLGRRSGRWILAPRNNDHQA